MAISTETLKVMFVVSGETYMFFFFIDLRYTVTLSQKHMNCRLYQMINMEIKFRLYF